MKKALAQLRKLLAYSKAIAALVGTTATYLLTILPPDQFKWLGIVAGVCTVVGTFTVPNIPNVPAGPSVTAAVPPVAVEPGQAPPLVPPPPPVIPPAPPAL